MNETFWKGPRGTTVIISHGSSKPPRWALLMLDRTAADAGKRDIGLRWTHGNGGGYFYPSPRVISVMAAGHGFLYERALLVHEMAHWLDPWPEGRKHGTTFWATALLLGRREKCERAIAREAGPTRARRARALIAGEGAIETVWRRLAA